MKIEATQTNYKKAYIKRRDAANKLIEVNGDTESSNLLRYYSVECGLKYLMMRKHKIDRTNKPGIDIKLKDLLESHRLNDILGALGVGSRYTFPMRFIKNNKKRTVDIMHLHEAFRYSVVLKPMTDDEKKKVQEIEQWISAKIAEGWQ